MYINLSVVDMEDVMDIAGCLPPCKYTEYEDVDLKEYELQYNDTLQSFGLTYATSMVTVKEEIPIYPFSSFLAEFGGALGLFLGFSFFMIWDFLCWLLHPT